MVPSIVIICQEGVDGRGGGAKVTVFFKLTKRGGI